MIEYLTYILVCLIDILLIEGVIIFAKTIYDDFTTKETGYVKIDEEAWEKLKEQTRRYNE